MPDKEFIILNRRTGNVRTITGPSLEKAIERLRLKPHLWREISQPYLIRLQQPK